MTEVAQALVEYAEELDEDTPGSGLEYLKDFRDRALGMISSGEGSSFVSSTVNGQSFSSAVNLSADRMFAILSEAIREYKGDAVRVTYAVVNGFPH